MAAKDLDQAQLIELICERPQNFAWFLGAGASRSAGLPTASDVLWIMKRRYYSTNEHQDIARQDLQNDAIRARIQSYMESRGFPEEWADGEYPAYFEKIFGEDRDRQRNYIKTLLAEEKVKLSIGHRVLGALLSMKLCRVVFTTNFDTVVEKAAAEVSGSSLSAYALDGAHNAVNALNNEEYPLYCKLHGDFRYDNIKNLPADLATQNEDLSACLINAAARFGLIICGYSGRDQSVMDLLTKALDQPNPFPHGLYWTHVGSGGLVPAVAELLEKARVKGIKAQAVPIETFDSLLSRIWRRIEDKPEKLQKRVQRTELATVNIPLPATGTAGPLLRLNSVPVHALPRQAHCLAFKKEMDWPALRKLKHDAESNIIFTKSDVVWCWGDRGEIEVTFQGDLISIKDIDLPTNIDEPEQRQVKALLEEALAIALVRERPLIARSGRGGTALIVDRHTKDVGALDPLFKLVGKTSGIIPGLMTEPTDEHPTAEQVAWAECVYLSLERRQGKTWLLLDPDIWIWPPRSRRGAVDFLDKRRADRYNSKYSGLLDAWIDILFEGKERGSEAVFTTFDGSASASNPSFTIGNRTGYSRWLKA